MSGAYRGLLGASAGLMLAILACAGSESPSPARPSDPAPAAKATTSPEPSSPVAAVPPLSERARTEDEQNTIAVFRAAAPATVFVTQNQLVLDRYSLRATETPTGAGSGFIWDEQGHVVTNYHVVAGARSLTVTLHDQSVWPAQLVGGDPRKDVAVLKIEAPESALVPVARPPEGYELEVGQKTLAIGNPFGLDHTLTTGVVSALGREIVGYGNVTIKGMIQTDASINPGNSGGPLLDSGGRLIGMNTMIFSQAGQSAGIGFAVPHQTVDRVVTQIITTGKVTQVGIGISALEDAIARRAGIDGVAVLEVLPGTPAAKAGLRGLTMTPRGARVGDVIVAVDGAEIDDYDDLYNALDPRKPGEKVKLGILREGQKVEVEVPLVVVNTD
jgi:S1-C subfamily serine protease